MTTHSTIVDTCKICGTDSAHFAITSTNQVGSPDLDTRPPEMLRSCVVYGIRRCPSCGYCAPSLAKGPEAAAELLKSDEYRDQLHSAVYSEAAASFLCWSMILERSGDYVGAGWSAVRAAWISDDEANTEAADLSRLQAIRLFGRASEGGNIFAGGSGADEALLADLLRRTGHFDEIEALVESGLKRKPVLRIARVLRYQQELAARGDRDRHTLDEVAR